MNNLISEDKVLLVGEIGINHNGSLEIAKSLIDIAKDAGFDVIKFQKRTIDIIYTQDELAKERKSPFGTTNGDLKRHLEFDFDDYKEIDRYCKEKEILWTASPWDIKSLEFIMQFDVPYIKIASASVTDIDLLKACSKTGKPLFISTGMCDLNTIEKVVNIIHAHNGDLQCIYHCISTYPPKPEEINLLGIEQLQLTFPDIAIGYSGHEMGILSSLMSVVLGVKSIERHITLSKVMYGSDQEASLDPNEMCDLSNGIKHITTLMGDGEIKVYDSEKPIIEKLRRINSL